MARGEPFTEAERMKIRLLHGRQMSATAIAKELKRSVSGVTSQAASMDLHFDREQTATATAAAATDMRARRARIAERLLREAEGALDDLHRPHMAYSFAAGGDPETRYSQHMVMPLPADKNQLMRAAQAALTEHRRLADFDADDTDGSKNARSLLGNLFATMAERVAAEPAPEQ